MRKRRKSQEELFRTWPSFTDIVSGILLLVILAFLVLLINSFFSSVTLAEKNEELARKNKEIEDLRRYAAPIRQSIQKLHAALSDGALNYTVREGTIVIGEAVLFDFDEYELKPSGEATLRNVGTRLKRFLSRQKHVNLSILIEGHTDKSGSDTYNINLGALRARSVYYFLRDEVGLDTEAHDVSISSQGEHHPVPGYEYDQASRRIEIHIRPQFEEFVQKVWDLFKEEER